MSNVRQVSGTNTREVKTIFIICRSVKIGLMEVGEGLARRGHEVTVVSPHKYKKVPDGVTEIIVESETFERFSQSFAEDILTNPDAGMSGKLLSVYLSDTIYE